MLSRLDSALRSESGEVLAAAIRTRFPVAMIDEFQDTDPSSTEFSPYLAPSAGNRIVADWRPEAGHICIPGADIFTYMKARSEVHAHYTLDTNWRSAPGMVNSVNKLSARLMTRSCFAKYRLFL